MEHCTIHSTMKHCTINSVYSMLISASNFHLVYSQDDRIGFEDAINHYLSKGYKLLGPPSINSTMNQGNPYSTTTYYQPMILQEEVTQL